jgi:hypothetical protein
VPTKPRCPEYRQRIGFRKLPWSRLLMLIVVTGVPRIQSQLAVTRLSAVVRHSSPEQRFAALDRLFQTMVHEQHHGCNFYHPDQQ